MQDVLNNLNFPHQEIAFKVALSSGIGLLVGLEREWAQKEIGVRTFAIAGLLGALTSLLIPTYVVAAMVGILLLVTFLNIHSLLKDRSLELTTSMCLIVVFFLGVMVGEAHYFTAATSAIVMMMLLAWKLELERFADALRPEEIRSAVLLCLLSVVIYPLLPNYMVDPWGLINPREDWIIVVVIAGIGFVNYVLLRLYSTKGMYYAALLGGLVNSTAAAVELSAQFKTQGQPPAGAVGVLLLTNISMFVRNIVILAIFAPTAVGSAAWPLGVMAVIAAALTVSMGGGRQGPAESLKLTSPVSLKRVIKFSLLFLLLACAGTLAQRSLGSWGFLTVSVLGGLVSSASTTATAAALVVSGKISPELAGVATVLTSMASALVTLPLVYQQIRQKALMRKLTLASIVIIVLGLVTLLVADGAAFAKSMTSVIQLR